MRQSQKISARFGLGRKRKAGLTRVLRGGSWNNNDPDNLLSSNRNHNPPENRNNNYGFRVVLVSVRKVSEPCTGVMWRGSFVLRRQCQEGSPNPVLRAPPIGEKTRRGPWPVGAILSGNGQPKVTARMRDFWEFVRSRTPIDG